jgi:hypothetical protein
MREAHYQQEYSNAEANYYSEGDAIHGQCAGRLAEDWGLKGAVEQEQFERLVDGRDPHTGEQLILTSSRAPTPTNTANRSRPRSIGRAGI